MCITHGIEWKSVATTKIPIKVYELLESRFNAWFLLTPSFTNLVPDILHKRGLHFTFIFVRNGNFTHILKMYSFLMMH